MPVSTGQQQAMRVEKWQSKISLNPDNLAIRRAAPRTRATRPLSRPRRYWAANLRGATRKAVDLALEGDTTALLLCLERIAPPRKDAPVSFSLPEMESAGDALTAINHIVQAVANGEITPNEATSMAGLVETFRRTAETQDLERRIVELEKVK